MPDEIVVVCPLYVGDQYETDLWVSADAMKQLDAFRIKKPEAWYEYTTGVKTCAKAGFGRYEGKKNRIRYKKEWRVYALEPRGTLFRLYGCYSAPIKREFIAISSTLKKGGTMRRKDKAAAEFAGKICKEHLWKKQGETE